MIIDFNQADAPISLNTTLCVVGSGVIGLTLISEFLDGLNGDILMVESGPEHQSESLALNNQVLNSGDVNSGVTGSMARVFGGAGTLWGGQALPFSSEDFKFKQWLDHSGWPIDHEQLNPYYERAAGVFGTKQCRF